MDNNLETFLIDIVKRIEEKVDDIKDSMVTKDDCKNNQESCSNKYKQKKIEMTPAKITAIGGVITIVTGFILAMIKLIK